MTRWLGAILSAAVLTVAGCGGPGGGTTPQATFELYKSAMADRNFEEAWNLLTAASQERMNRDAQDLAQQASRAEGSALTDLQNKAKLMDRTVDDLKKMDGKMLYVGLLKMASQTGKEDWARLSRARFSRVETHGDRATVFDSVDGKEEARTLPLLLDGGTWKIDMMSVKTEVFRPASPKEAPKDVP